MKASKLLQGSYYRYSRSKFIEKTAQARYNAAKAKPSKFKLGVAGAFSVFIIGKLSFFCPLQASAYSHI